ncbi:MAG TPA: branched-chain amino acid ABC transporter permease [Alphaproteobacteria bacterium]|nr:branched-chain amino acid ABC transporter permease [Alphaproteobacteria bacterium]
MIELLNAAVSGVVLGLITALAALAMTLVMGVARFPNAATGDYMTLGAYAAVIAQQHGSASLALNGLLAILVTAAVALFFHWAVFRKLTGRSIVAPLLASIGVAFLLRALITLAFGSAQRIYQVPLVRPHLFGGVRILPTDIDLALAAAIALAFVLALLHLTPIGRRMRAVADNPALARASGIRAWQAMGTLWVTTGAICAVAGVLLGIKTVVTPEMGWNLLLPTFAAAILGGVGSPAGAVVAGLLLGIVQEVATPFLGSTYKIVLAFVVLLFVLLVRPQGLFGRLERVR